MLQHREANFSWVVGVLFDDMRIDTLVARRFVGRSAYGDECQHIKVFELVSQGLTKVLVQFGARFVSRKSIIAVAESSGPIPGLNPLPR
jgi:hypothetical protein